MAKCLTCGLSGDLDHLLGEAGALLPPNTIIINGVLVPIIILGNLILAWLMKPYPDNTGPGRRRFSYMTRSCGMVVECGFGRITVRRCNLLTSLGALVDNAGHVIAVCCALHHICKVKGEHFYGVDARQNIIGQGQSPIVALTLGNINIFEILEWKKVLS